MYSFSETVQATNKEDAELQVRQKLNQQFVMEKEDSPHIIERGVKEIDFVTREPPKAQATEDMNMKSGKYVDYDFIPHDTTHFKEGGFCVVDVLLGVYAGLPRNKKLTREWIMERCQHQEYYAKDEECHEQAWKEDSSNWVWMDAGDPLGGLSLRLRRPFPGISPRMVYNMCVELDISHYAFDLTGKCFLKHVCKGKNNHGPALVHYAIDNHMYYLDRGAENDKGVNIVQSLVKEAVAMETNHQSCMLKPDATEKVNVFAKYEIHQNMEVSQLLN